MSRGAYKMVFRASRPDGAVKKTRTIYAQDYEEAVDIAAWRGRMLLNGTELDWSADVDCPSDETRE